jgi:hypothetical protein
LSNKMCVCWKCVLVALRHKFDLLKHNFLPESSNVCFSPERNDVRFCQKKLKRKMRKIQI